MEVAQWYDRQMKARPCALCRGLRARVSAKVRPLCTKARLRATRPSAWGPAWGGLELLFPGGLQLRAGLERACRERGRERGEERARAEGGGPGASAPWHQLRGFCAKNELVHGRRRASLRELASFTLQAPKGPRNFGAFGVLNPIGPCLEAAPPFGHLWFELLEAHGGRARAHGAAGKLLEVKLGSEAQKAAVQAGSSRSRARPGRILVKTLVATRPSIRERRRSSSAWCGSPARGEDQALFRPVMLLYTFAACRNRRLDAMQHRRAGRVACEVLGGLLSGQSWAEAFRSRLAAGSFWLRWLWQVRRNVRQNLVQAKLLSKSASLERLLSFRGARGLLEGLAGSRALHSEAPASQASAHTHIYM